MEPNAEMEMPKRRRRRGQRGSIVPRNGGFSIVYRMPNGKQKWESGFSTKRAAQDRLTDVLRDIKENKFVEETDVLFGEFCKDLMEKSKGVLKPKTWASYQSALDKWILPKFKDWPMCDVSRAVVKTFVDGLLANHDLSRKFVKNVVILLHKIFEEAVDRELIAANPAHRIKLPRPESESVELASDVVVPTTEEVALTFAQLPATYQALLATSAITGLRRGELLGLYWDDVDGATGVLTVRRTLQRVKKSLLSAFRGVEAIGNTGLALVAPKSKRARRRIEMPPKLAGILIELRALQNGTASPFVFQNQLGAPLDPDAVYDVLHEAQDKAGVRRFGLHGLRHLFASLLVSSGADIKFAQDRLGHASATTTLDIYSHVVTENGREFAEKVEAAFPFVSVTLAGSNQAGNQPKLLN